MTLKEFIKRFVCKNSLIRLWKPTKGGKQMIFRGDDSACMEWEVLQDKVWQSEYGECTVVGVSAIVVDDSYREAINIVINA